MAGESGTLISYVMGLLLKKIVVPANYHDRVKVVKSMQEDDISGLVDSLTDFAVDSATVDFNIETDNSEFSKILKKWLDTVNIAYNGKIPSGIKALAKEYFRERWKYSSFPVLKIAKWDTIDKIIVPTKMFFVDGGSIYAEDIENDDSLRLIGYKYFLGKDKNKRIELNKNCIFARPYGRWFDKYPVPYLIKRGIYHNWKIINAIKNMEYKILEQVIPYMMLIKKGSESLVREYNKVYSNEELNQVICDLQELAKNLSESQGAETPIRATNFDEEIKHLIPDLTTIFNEDLFAVAEKNILTGLGFIDIAEAVSSSRRESILNPKVFIEEVRTGVEDFKQILKELVLLIIEKNAEIHPKYISSNFYITASPVKAFMTDDFKTHLRFLWKNGKLSDQTYCEMVGEVDFRTEVARREKEAKEGTEIIMYPHQTQNREDTESFEEIKRQQRFYEEETIEDKNGKPLPPDKTEPEQKEEYDTSKMNLEGSPYKTIKELPARIRKNLSLDLQGVFLKVFNNAYDTYHSESRAFRVAWGVIKKLARKNKKGIWVRKRKRIKGKLEKVKLTKAMIEDILEKEEAKNIDEVLQLKKLELMEKQNKLADKLLNNSKDK